MRLEHTALNVEDAPAVANWWVEHLGMSIVRANDTPPYMTFLSDGQGSIIELYSNEKVAVPDYSSMHPLELHLAFVVDGDLEATRQTLIRGGAEPEGDIETTPAGDQVVFLRDPWGVALQLVKRTQPME